MIKICTMCQTEYECSDRAHSRMYCDACLKIYKAQKQREYYAKNQEYCRQWAVDYRKTHDTSRNDEYIKARVQAKNKRYFTKLIKHYPPTCYICNQQKKLALHHKNFIPDDNRVENLIQLCYSCHKRVHSGVETID